MNYDIPKHWIKGQLLDLTRYADGSFLAVALGEEYKPELANGIHFDSGHDAQNFVSQWYQREFGPHG